MTKKHLSKKINKKTRKSKRTIKKQRGGECIFRNNNNKFTNDNGLPCLPSGYKGNNKKKQQLTNEAHSDNARFKFGFGNTNLGHTHSTYYATNRSSKGYGNGGKYGFNNNNNAGFGFNNNN